MIECFLFLISYRWKSGNSTCSSSYIHLDHDRVGVSIQRRHSNLKKTMLEQHIYQNPSMHLSFMTNRKLPSIPRTVISSNPAGMFQNLPLIMIDSKKSIFKFHVAL